MTDAALQVFTEQLGIRVLPTKDQHKRGAGETCASGTIAEILEDWGSAHATIVMRAILESSEENAKQLTRPVILAVSDVLLAHDRWANSGLSLLTAMDQVNLARLWEIARATKVPARHAIATMLAIDLERLLGPSVLPKPETPPRAKREKKPPRSVTRIPEIERNIALGLELLKLRSTTDSNKAFGSLRRQHFPDVDGQFASNVMRVARLYGTRPDIYRRRSWQALLRLSSPSMAADVRRNAEARAL